MDLWLAGIFATPAAGDEKEQRVTAARTGSVRDLNGFLQKRRRKLVTIEEVNAAIVRGAFKRNT